MSDERLYQVDWKTGRGAPCFGIVARHGLVHEVAPVAHWSYGEPIAKTLHYFRSKGAHVILVREDSVAGVK